MQKNKTKKQDKHNDKRYTHWEEWLTWRKEEDTERDRKIQRSHTLTTHLKTNKQISHAQTLTNKQTHTLTHPSSPLTNKHTNLTHSQDRERKSRRCNISWYTVSSSIFFSSAANISTILLSSIALMLSSWRHACGPV